MATLQDYKKQRGYTNKDIAHALGCSLSKASSILHGAYLSDEVAIRQVCNLFKIDRETCIDAMIEAREQAEARWKEKHPPRPEEEIEAERKAYADRIYAKMSDADKRELHAWAVKHGYGQDTRSPIERMIDKAVGRD